MFTVKTLESYNAVRRLEDVEVGSGHYSKANQSPRHVPLIIYKESDRVPIKKHHSNDSSSSPPSHSHHQGCGTDSLHYNSHGGAQQNYRERRLLQLYLARKQKNYNWLEKRDSSTAGCPTTKKVLYMVCENSHRLNNCHSKRHSFVDTFTTRDSLLLFSSIKFHSLRAGGIHAVHYKLLCDAPISCYLDIQYLCRKLIVKGVAADCTFVNNLHSSPDAALKQIISDWNQASQLFETTFNVALAILTVNIQTSCDQSNDMVWNQICAQGYSISQRLSDFSKWRGEQKDNAGLWHLMSFCSTDTTIGISWLGALCLTAASGSGSSTSTSSTAGGTITGTSYVSGTGITTSNANEWIIVAHEIGHSFGTCFSCSRVNDSRCHSWLYRCNLSRLPWICVHLLYLFATMWLSR